MKDQKLIGWLKKVTPKKKMFFGFVCEGTLGHLIVQPSKKLRDDALLQAKKDGKKGTQVKGICRGTLKAMEFLFDKEVIKGDKLSDRIEKVSKQTAVAVLVSSCRPANAKELKELDEEEKDTKVAEKPEGPEDAATDAEPEPVEPEADPGADELDIAGWQAAVQAAVADLKALAAKVVSTRHDSAKGVVLEISDLCKLLTKHSAPEAHDLDLLEALVLEHDTISAAEEFPPQFHKVEIRKPLLRALALIRKSQDATRVA